MKAHVYVTLKASVLDPQGQTIHNALRKIGFADVTAVRQGKYFALSLADALTAKPRAPKSSASPAKSSPIPSSRIQLQDRGITRSPQSQRPDPERSGSAVCRPIPESRCPPFFVAIPICEDYASRGPEPQCPPECRIPAHSLSRPSPQLAVIEKKNSGRIYILDQKLHTPARPQTAAGSRAPRFSTI